MTNALPLTCPVCGEKTNRPPRLIQDGKTLRCPKGHSFDVSAKGYVNLLLTQHKNVKDPGDSKEMAEPTPGCGTPCAGAPRNTPQSSRSRSRWWTAAAARATTR